MRISVISSSSLRQLQELMLEVAFHAPDVAFDLFFLRESDIKELTAELHQTDRPRTAFDLWRRPQKPEVGNATKAFCENHFKWMTSAGLSFGAFATYFPGLSSMDKTAFKTAIHGLTDAVLIARKACDAGLMKIPIVEAVCGIVSERCLCDECRGKRHVAVFSDKAKQERLIKGLQRVVELVQFALKPRSHVEQQFLIGLELEPGAGYVLRDNMTLDEIMGRIKDTPGLSEHVGINLDVGHMRIAGVTANDLQKYEDKIVHAHISDHPSMHTRDHYLGAWTDIAHPNEFDPYIKLLKRRLTPTPEGERPGLGFSGTVAIELEGCNRLEWVLRSIQELRRLLARNGIPRP